MITTNETSENVIKEITKNVLMGKKVLVVGRFMKELKSIRSELDVKISEVCPPQTRHQYHLRWENGGEVFFESQFSHLLGYSIDLVVCDPRISHKCISNHVLPIVTYKSGKIVFCYL